MAAISAELALAHQMADRAREIAMRHFRRAELVKNKAAYGSTATDRAAAGRAAAGFDPTTAADIEIETMMREMIKSEFPAHAIIGEEFGGGGGGARNLSDQPCWIIDPIDGTRNYYAGSLFWGILIALVEKNRTRQNHARLGMIDHPPTGERFFAEGQNGFWQQGDRTLPLKTSANTNLNKATLAATTPHIFTPTELHAFNHISNQAAITLFGGNCYFYGLLALGHIGLVIESSLEIYDIAGLIPVVEAAGGIISDWQGGSPFNGGQIIAAANSTLHQQALALLASAAK